VDELSELVSTMSDDEQRKRIIEEAKAHLDGSWSPERFPSRSELVASPPMRRTNEPGDLVFKSRENAQVAAATGAETRANDDAWNQWLERAIDRRLEQERAEMIEILGEVVAKLRSEYQRDTDRDAEINAEFVKIWRSITQATKTIVDIQREKVERAFRNAVIDPNVKMN